MELLISEEYMQLNRKLSPQEKRLLEVLIKKASIILPEDWQNKIIVRSMNDDGMGSLILFPDGIISDHRLFGVQVSECSFIDEDGVHVIASLNLDSNGDLFELDIWKTDYSSLINIPDKFDESD
jgi:hypothetical protein